VYVANTWGHTVMKFNSELEKVDEWGGPCTDLAAGCDPFELFAPREIIVTQSGNVMIVDTGLHRMVEYTPDGDFVREFGANGTGGGALEFNEPVGLVQNPAGDMYVVDFWNRRIVVLDPSLNLKTTIPVDAWGSTLVTDRAYIAVLADGRIVATDPTNGKVLVFGADGAPLGAYDLPKETGHEVVRPVGIAADLTHLIISDSAGHVVRKIPIAEVAP
jgi:DNA-binding beta-propeller fold protein YncE